MSGWPIVELKGLVQDDRGISYGIVQPGRPVTDGVPIVRVSDVRGGRIDISNPLKVSPTVEASYVRTRLRGGELLVTVVGTIGETAIVSHDIAGWNVARAVAVVPVRPEVGAYWVKLALCAPASKQMMQSHLNTTVQPTLNLGVVAKLPIVLPPTKVRERIASILGAYDDLIEVNRRRIAVLEEMARRLFDEWFVHFRFPGHEGRKMVETEHGSLPEGWRWARLDEMLVLQRGFDLPTTLRGEGPYPVVTGSGFNGFHCEAKVQPPGIVTGRSGTIGKVFLVDRPFWPLNTALYVKEFRRSSPMHALHVLRSIDLKSRAVGAAVPTLNRNHVHGLPIADPPPELVARFEHFAAQCLRAAGVIDETQERLAASRDLLLPRLISGDLSVAGAERDLDTAA